MLANRQQIGQCLYRMQPIRQTVDHRNVGGGSQFVQGFVRIHSCHNRVAHAAQHAGSIADGFAAPQLGVARTEIHRVAAKLGHRYLKANASAGRRLFKNHRQRPPRQKCLSLLAPLSCLQFRRRFQQIMQFRIVQIRQRQQIPTVQCVVHWKTSKIRSKISSRKSNTNQKSTYEVVNSSEKSILISDLDRLILISDF